MRSMCTKFILRHLGVEKYRIFSRKNSRVRTENRQSGIRDYLASQGLVHRSVVQYLFQNRNFENERVIS